MNKTSLRLKLAKMLLKFSTVETDKGTIYFEGELAEGLEVFVEDENGEMIPAPNGDYTVDTQIITIEEGVITAIKPVEPEEEEEMEEEVAEEPATEDAIMTLANEIEMLKAEIENLKAEIEGIKNAAVDTSAEDTFSKQTKKSAWEKI